MLNVSQCQFVSYLNRFLCCFILVTFSCVPSIYAQQVTKARGKKAIVDLQGKPAETGQTFYLVSADGKKKGIVRVLRVTRDKALVRLLKGKSEVGWKLVERRSKEPKPQDAKEVEAQPAIKPDRPAMGLGLMLGYGLDSMEVDVAGKKYAHSGSGISYKVMADLPIISQLYFRAFAGIENFSAKSDTKLPSGNEAKIDISYMVVDFWGRWIFIPTGMFRPWAGAAVSLLFPSSKESTSVDESTISNTSLISVGGGVDLYVTPNFYIPFQVDYGLLPSSSEVSGNIIGIRLGAGFSF